MNIQRTKSAVRGSYFYMSPIQRTCRILRRRLLHVESSSLYVAFYMYNVLQCTALHVDSVDEPLLTHSITHYVNVVPELKKTAWTYTADV